MATEFKLPELGENITSGDVVRVLVAPGDVVAAEQPVIELETDKATIEVPSPVAGRVEAVHVKAGDKVAVGQIILTIDEQSSAGERGAAGPVEANDRPAGGDTAAAMSVAAAPSVRRLARELGVDISRVAGSGPGGRVAPDDVKALARAVVTGRAAAPAVAGRPLPDFSKWGPIERRAMGGIRRATAEHVSRAWLTIPHVTQHDVADITA